jgi:hypothetical protein
MRDWNSFSDTQKWIYGIVLSIFAVAFTSCGTMSFFKTSDFAEIGGIGALEGNYMNRTDSSENNIIEPITGGKFYYGSLITRFRIYNDNVDEVRITAVSPKEIKLTYRTGNDLHEQIFSGKMKRKYFEYYHFKDQIIIPLIFTFIDVYRIRVGKSKDGELLIRSYRESSRSILIFGGKWEPEDVYKFPPADEKKIPLPR